MTPTFTKVSNWLPGTYSNRDQAHAEPVWFIPVTLWYVALPDLFREGLGFFTEQVADHSPQSPYRSRVLHLVEHEGAVVLENYRLLDQAAWAGSARVPDRLAQLTLADLILLPGCLMDLQDQGPRIHGVMPGSTSCLLNPESTSYIQISFDLTEHTFFTLDRGFDRTTNAQVWGSRAGAYEYHKLP